MRHLLPVLLVMPLLIGNSVAIADNINNIEFSNPNDTFSMPAEWSDKPVQYEYGVDADVVVSLDQQSYVALHDKILAYAKDTNTHIIVKQGTCGLTRSQLEKKAVDIGGFCCPPGKSDRLPGAKFHTLGVAAIALFVHPTNKLETVTLQQARDLFNGNIENWSQLGLKNSYPIIPVARLHCKKRPGHWKLLLHNEDRFSMYLHDVGVIPDMISKVAKGKNTIGFETLLMAEKHKDKGVVKAISIDGISPDNSDALVRTAYPLYRTYNVTTWTGKNTSDQAEKLVRYLLDTTEEMEPYHFISHKRLRAAGWQFNGNELIGTPKVIHNHD